MCVLTFLSFVLHCDVPVSMRRRLSNSYVSRQSISSDSLRESGSNRLILSSPLVITPLSSLYVISMGAVVSYEVTRYGV